MDKNKWKKLKRSGAFRRKVNKTFQEMRNSAIFIEPNLSSLCESSANRTSNTLRGSAVSSLLSHDEHGQNIESEPRTSRTNPFDSELANVPNLCDLNHESDNEVSSDTENYSNSSGNEIDYDDINFQFDLKEWAIQYNISHDAFRGLATIINKKLPHILPKDPRTFLKTDTKKIILTPVGSGYYWHKGLTECLKQILEHTHIVCDTISVLINIDGLPVYKSSNHQFWPILCKILEIDVSPLIIGIYEGHEKPSDLDRFLGSFVNEMKELQNSLTIINNQEEKLIQIKIKAFVCDSPARAMIKGVTNFNGKHGCTKCTTVGEYSYNSHTVVFPNTSCPSRTDKDFRDKKYGEHHKKDSPLLKLNIDMIEDFPVSDSLHLIDLGVMKRLLMGWRDGKFGKYTTKWRGQDIKKVSKFLTNCHKPKEIHRAIRPIEVLAHWKGSEYRTFLYYLSFIILKHVLCDEAYQHFLTFFCAITICSSEKYFHILEVADKLLNAFIENFGKYYGKDYITSNIHNLCHIVQEVKKFGKLQDYNAYPFENELFTIKKLIRHGQRPLAQVARRLSERQSIEFQNLNNKKMIYPCVKSSSRNNLKFLQLKDFVLSTQQNDKWFLSGENHVVEIENIIDDHSNPNNIQLHGKRILNLEDVFEIPIKSSTINIYKCYADNVSKSTNVYNVSEIKCKLFSVTYKSMIYFTPLLHSL